MIPSLRKFVSFLRRDREEEEAAVDEHLQTPFRRLRGLDPETHQEWLRLEQSISAIETTSPSAQRRLIPRLALASACVVFALVGGYLYFAPSPASPRTYATGKGEQKDVVLADGSEVTLNHTTNMIVRDLRQGNARRLSLTGEAFFRVRHNDTPFIVSTGSAEVRVVGTEFNVRARERSVEVVVVRGIVNVNAVRDGKDSVLRLSEHQAALCPVDGVPRRIGDISSTDYPGWMHGKLFLSGSSLRSACREIESRFDVAISLDDGNVGETTVTGVLESKSAESAIAALCELTGHRYARDGQRYHIY